MCSYSKVIIIKVNLHGKRKSVNNCHINMVK